MSTPFADIKNIAVLCRGAFGDLISTDVVLQHLRSLAPSAYVTLIVDQRNYPIVPFMQHYDDVIILPAKGNKYWYLFKAALRYRERNFDLVITEKGSPSRMVNLFLKLLGKKYQFAYVDDNWHGRLLKNGKMYDPKIKDSVHHAVESLRLLLPDIQEVPVEYYPKLKLPSDFISRCSADVIHEFNQLKNPVIFVAVTNNRPACFFGVEKYAEILNKLHQQFDFSVVISFLKNDMDKAKALQEKLMMPSMMPETKNFNDLIYLLVNAQICLLGDGGLTHMAAGFDKLQLVLFGAISPIAWRPLSNQTVCLYDEKHVVNIKNEAILSQLGKFFETMNATKLVS